MSAGSRQKSESPAATGPIANSSFYAPFDERQAVPSPHGGIGMDHDREKFARNVRGGTSRPLAYTITQREFLARSKQAFREFAGSGPGAAKRVADALQCSDKTAHNYIEGRNAPGGIHDLRAMHAIPPYAAMKREIAAIEGGLDPRVLAKVLEFAEFVREHGPALLEMEAAG